MIYIISFLLATKWLRILWIPTNDKIRHYLFANYNKNTRHLRIAFQLLNFLKKL